MCINFDDLRIDDAKASLYGERPRNDARVHAHREMSEDTAAEAAAERAVANAMELSGCSYSPIPPELMPREERRLSKPNAFLVALAGFFGRMFCCEQVDEVLSKSLPRIDSFLAAGHLLPPQAPQNETFAALVRCLDAGPDDLYLRRMVTAFEQMIYALETLGGWTYLAKREVRANLAKLEQSQAVQRERAPRLRSALRYEKDSGMHKKGALADPSAALALTWLHRFLMMWCDLWIEPRPPTFREALMRAYGTHIQPHHSWILRRTFSIAVSVVPSWATARERLNEFDERGEAGMLKNVAMLRLVLSRIDAALTEEGLSDQCVA